MLGMALGLGTTLMMSSCGGGVDVVSEGVQPVFAGSYDTDAATPPNSTACYWEGTLRTDLSGGTGSVTAHAYSPSTSALNNIYTPGTWSDGTKTYACYWIGTTRTDLTVTGATSTYATCITLSGTDIFVGGYYTTDGTTYIPCYWKNNTAKTLDAGTYSARVTGIGVSDARVFCSGSYTDSSVTWACYWDSNSTGLKKLATSATATSAKTYGIVVTNEVPWIVGHYVDGAKNLPCVWKETVKFDLDLPSGTGDADVYAITVKGNDSEYLYCAGYIEESAKDVPCYWGVDISDEDDPHISSAQTLTNPDGYTAKAYALFSSGDKLWIGGNYNNGSVDIPHYWKEGGNPGSPKLPDNHSLSARIACGPDVP
jgi:hypothetical protein